MADPKDEGKPKRGFFARCCGGVSDDETNRTVHINAEYDHPYVSNVTSTTKYNLLTFFPKALFEQYRRIANIYFTLVAALSLTPVSPVRPWTTWTPLAIVLGVAMIKEAIEDYKRYKADKEINNRMVEVYSPTARAFVERKWRDILVGDLIIIKKDDAFPADVLFISSESEEGTCYVETMNLDGETNLKIKKCPDLTKTMVRSNVGDLKGQVQCELPNARLYQFSGNLELGPPIAAQATVVSVSPSAVILRGCSLRNTAVVFGVVIFAGHDTKVFMNATEAPSKRSRIERGVDYIILFMFSLLFSMCMTGCVYFGFWTAEQSPKAWYLVPYSTPSQYNPDNGALVAFFSFITSFILYGYLIPIALYVSIEIVKVIQAMVFINLDRDMYHADTDTPALARTSNLNEELGMVNTILSDKTGTLTRNVMEFFKASIAGVSYGAGVTEIERANAERRGQQVVEMDESGAASIRERFFNFYDERLMGTTWTKEADPVTIEMFFRLLAVCHTVIPDGPDDPAVIKYEAESPDEAALVVAAKVFGFFCYKRTNTTVSVRERTAKGTVDVTYEVLNVIEFTSTRKRMSVIVRSPTGQLLVFCKGADTVIYERLDPKYGPNAAMKESTNRHMENYGSSGLRTLCLAWTEVDSAFYDTWQAQWMEAKTSLQDRDEKLGALGEHIEKNLRLLGATAIEDKLQEGVPSSIEKLAQAGIRLWVLTGDKMETAINIAYACRLITDEMQQFIISAYFPDTDAMEEAGDAVGAAKLANQRIKEQLEQVQRAVASADGRDKFAMIIDGKALSYALSETLKDLFLVVGGACAAVVCCRVSPLQKAQVTALVRSRGDTTLAIGDGANDVGMIQKAHIGVGISGQEGMQAVMAADFAIAQFRFLVPLLLIHGRWSYKRLTRMICFFFYKNILFGTTIFIFNAFSNFSGSYLFQDFTLTLYNVVFTALTPIVIGLFDRDVDKHLGMKYPSLYMQGQRNENFNVRSVAAWLASGLMQAGIMMTFVLVGCDPTTSDRGSGQAYSLYPTGVLLFSIIIVTVHLEVAQVLEQWTYFHHLAIWLSQIVWWLYVIVFGAFPINWATDYANLFIGIVAESPQYWLYLLLTPLACQLPDFFVRNLRDLLWPPDHLIVKEIETLLLRESKGHGLRPVASESGLSTIPLTSAMSDAKGVYTPAAAKSKNSGFVPPYDPNSRFYKMVGATAANRGQKSLVSPNSKGPSNPAALKHLETEVVDNPYRSSRYKLPPIVATGSASPAPRMATAPNAAPPLGVAHGIPIATPGQILTPTGDDGQPASTGQWRANGTSGVSPQDAQMLEAYTSALR